MNSYPEAPEQPKGARGCKACGGWERSLLVYNKRLEGTELIFTLATLFIPPTRISTANWLQMDSYIPEQVYQRCAASLLRLDLVVLAFALENIL